MDSTQKKPIIPPPPPYPTQRNSGVGATESEVVPFSENNIKATCAEYCFKEMDDTVDSSSASATSTAAAENDKSASVQELTNQQEQDVRDQPSGGKQSIVPPPHFSRPPPPPQRPLLGPKVSSRSDSASRVPPSPPSTTWTSETASANGNTARENDSSKVVILSAKSSKSDEAKGGDTGVEEKEQILITATTTTTLENNEPLAYQTRKQEESKPTKEEDGPLQRIKVVPDVPSHRAISALEETKSDEPKPTQQQQQQQQQFIPMPLAKTNASWQNQQEMGRYQPQVPYMRRVHAAAVSTQQYAPARQVPNAAAVIPQTGPRKSPSGYAEQYYGKQQPPPPQQQQERYVSTRHHVPSGACQRVQTKPRLQPPSHISTPRELKSSVPVPALQSLWSRVESTLDDLANFEDAVTNRASNLVSTAVPQKWRRPPKVARNPPAPPVLTKPGTQSVARKGPTSQPLFTPQVRWQQQRESQKRNARKLMPANGGASSPSDYLSWNYPGSDQTQSTTSAPTQPGVDVIGSRQGPDGAKATPEQQGSAETAPKPPVSGHPYSSKPERQQEPAPESRSKSAFTEQTRRATVATKPTTPQAYYDDDDDDKPSLLSRTLGAIPMPSIGALGKLFRLRRGSVYNNYSSLDAWEAQDGDEPKGFFAGFRRKKVDDSPVATDTKKRTASDHHVPIQVQSLLERNNKGKTASLLSPGDKRIIQGIGKSRATLDALSLVFFIWGAREMRGLEGVPFPTGLYDFFAATFPSLLTCILESYDTWTPIALTAAFLTTWTNSLLHEGRVKRNAAVIARSVQAEASYGRLFLRLVSSTPTESSLPSKLSKAADLQVIAQADLTRLRSYVTYAITAIVLMTVDFIPPLLMTFIGSFVRFASLSELRTWPIPLHKLAAETKAIFGGVGRDVSALVGGELKIVGHHPMQVAFKASILAALFAVACLPALEKKRKFAPSDDAEEEKTEEVSRRMAEQITEMGASSASRLALLSENRGIESTIERWRLLQEESSEEMTEASIGSLFRRLGYKMASWSILIAPVLIFGILLDVPISGWTSSKVSHWEAMFEVTLLLLTTNGLAWKALSKLVDASSLRPEVLGFVKSLAQAAEDVIPQKSSPQPLRSGANPTAGLLVKNFWAAHTVKRAWAVRGANLFCRNGEVLLVLGDDGVGKSRLLTAIAESIVAPPKQALTSQIQRGSVSVGGIDVTQWDRSELKKRVGLILSDIRTISNTADLWSGLSLEEILEPGDGLGFSDPAYKSGAREKNCMIQALKITGLYWSLLPRLPSKLSTVLTSSEEDLRPSAMRPRFFVLSPPEWHKLMLAKLLAQAIYDSASSDGKNDKIDRCLVGSLFLLDDATMLMSEMEESKVIQDLKRTGVATVLSANKWATGRLADRIAVVKDGAIIETGTHSELLSRGPQHSYYAAKWQAMTSA